MGKTICVLGMALILLPAVANAEISSEERCLLEALATSPDSVTVADLKAQCLDDGQAAQPRAGAVDERMAAEARVEAGPWGITPHGVNYVLPVSYNSQQNSAMLEDLGLPADTFEDTEVKFQISFKFPLAQNLFNDSTDLYFAYTNRSWWQLYADGISSPFRETNHMPEFFFRIRKDWDFWGLRTRFINLGYIHQSNGRTGSLSRSWDRLFADLIVERGNLGLGLRAWAVLGDPWENPDITDYMGHGELRGAYLWGDNTFSGLMRNNLDLDDNKGGYELSWSRPLAGVVRLYAQYYNGYGESLVDYDHRVNRFSLGFSVGDLLQN